MRRSRLALFQSFIALLLCFSMLVGTTFAWFTDAVSTGINTIAAGNLDVELFHSNATVTQERVDSSSKLFLDLQGDPILWEPGVVSYENLRVTNAGDLALAYQLAINTANENYVVDPSGANYGLSQILKVGVVEGGITASDRAGVVASVAASDWTTLSSFVRNGSLLPEGAGESEKTWGVVIYWEPGTTDNYWNLNNGKTVSTGETLTIDLGISLVATQEQYESDAFGNDYDTTAKTDVFPELVVSGSATTTVTPNDQNQIDANIEMTTGQVTASIPAGVQLAEGTTELTMSVSEMNSSGSNITLGKNEAMRSLDVHINGVDATNTVPMIIDLGEVMPIGLNEGNAKAYHVENSSTNAMTRVATLAELDAHNEFFYDPATGRVAVAMATFSEVAVVADTENAWEGKIATAFSSGSGTATDPYLIANADQLAYLNELVSHSDGEYSAAYYKLLSDIVFAGETSNKDHVWYPIGYHAKGSGANAAGESVWYTYGGAFSGVFDGAGHKVSNIYQNTWIMDGNYDNGYWKEAMGLFGYVYGGTVKNLTIHNFYSEGEFAPTGCVAAYAANATFENIAITGSHPQTYNTSVAAVVGRDGKNGLNNNNNYNLVFRNITVDSTNTVSALWGSWDVGAAGLLGYLGSDSKVLLENCRVSPTIDVYNDVCGNYQYYWYRYCGMLIGTVDKTKADGSLDLSNITAKNCTVDFGDRHEYYYCEFIDNSIASYTHDYQFSRVEHDELDFTQNPVVCTHAHSDKTEVIGSETVLVEDKRAVYIPFRQIFGGYGWGVKGTEITETGIQIKDITVEWKPGSTVEKFDSKFTGEFLYRVGNAKDSTVSLGTLFKEIEGAKINNTGVYVTIDKVDENSNVAGTFTANTTDWTKGTIQFTGTGLVKVTIQDYDYCTPTELKLEVVDAVNATGAANATKNNVVLLNDCGFNSLEVSGGYTLYGNGFTMTCSSDSASLGFGEFVKLDNGTLDNVQIVCPNYDFAALYNSQLTGSGNRSQTTDKTRYYNAKSAVAVSGNSQIMNSRISGGRAALYASNGNIVVENSRLEGGAVATVLISAANSVVFRDATLIQKPTASTYDSNKTLMGMSVLYLCDADGNATPTKLEGTFVQNAWADSSCIGYMPEGTSSIASTVLNKTKYQHTISGKTCVNLGFAYMPNDGTTVNQPNNITDNRTNKNEVPYAYESVSASVPVSGLSVNISTYVYSYQNTNGTNDGFNNDQGYKPDQYSDIITITYSDSTDGLTSGKSYGTDGWVYELNVDLDKLSSYALDFSKLSMSINGVNVTDFKVNGNTKPVSPVEVTVGGKTYTLTATIDGEEYTATYVVTGVETSKRAPYLVDENGKEIGINDVTWGIGVCVTNGSDYSGAAPVLENLYVRYWSVAGSEYKTIKLSDLTPTENGKVSSESKWTTSEANNDYTLTIENTTAIHSGQSIFGMPVVYEGKLYFTISSTKGMVSSGSGARQIKMKYVFEDNNSATLTFEHTWSVAYDKNNSVKYSDMVGDNGSSSGGCLTPDTLITLANGKQVRVDSLTGTEELLVWNLETGKYDTAPIVFVDSEEEMEYEVIHLYFSDGSDVKVIYEHGFFDLDLGKYVYIDAANYADYVGHRFVTEGNVTANKWNIVTLDKVELETEVTTAWSPVTFEHLCYYTNGVLSMPGGIEGLFNIFEVNTDTMRYDAAQMQRDIETYGLLTLEDFGGMITEEAFQAFNGAYLKVAMGKGLLTWEDIAYMAERYIPLM